MQMLLNYRYKVMPTAPFDAVNFQPATTHKTSLPIGMQTARPGTGVQDNSNPGAIFFIITPTGYKVAVAGDWITNNQQGQKDVVKPDVFAKFYEMVPTPPGPQTLNPPIA